MAEMNIVSNLVGAIEVGDGTSPTPLTIAAAFSGGDASFGPILGPGRMHEVVDLEQRGRNQGQTLGKRIYCEGSFSCMLDKFTGAKIGPFILGTGATYGAAGSTPSVNVDGASHPVRKLTLRLSWDGSSVGGADEEFTFERAHIKLDKFDESELGIKLSISWKTYGDVLDADGVVIASERA